MSTKPGEPREFTEEGLMSERHCSPHRLRNFISRVTSAVSLFQIFSLGPRVRIFRMLMIMSGTCNQTMAITSMVPLGLDVAIGADENSIGDNWRP